MGENEQDDKTQTFTSIAAGKIVGHFTIEKPLGAGGMGTVFLAKDSELERRVALKCLSPELAADEQFQARFRREAKTLANLNHPNVVAIYEVFQFEQRSFIAMEYVDGQPLNEVKNLSLVQLCELAIEIAAGLKAAHHAEIVHRDIKPANIFVSRDGVAKILDFGLARKETDEEITRAGTTVGTFAYMSPEQVKGSAVDKRSDIFSFGVVLYELILGRRPFRGEYAAEVAHKIVSEPPSAIDAGKFDLPDELRRIILRCLEKDPANRYQDAQELHQDLLNAQLLIEEEERRGKDYSSVNTQTRMAATAGSADQVVFPTKPLLPSKKYFWVGFALASIAIISSLAWTPRQFRTVKDIKISPTQAEARALGSLGQLNSNLFGFRSYTMFVEDKDLQMIERHLGLSDSAYHAINRWSPESYYQTVVLSANDKERYDFYYAPDGRLFRFRHLLLSESKADSISVDTLRSIATRYADSLLALKIADLVPMPDSVSKDSGHTYTHLRWTSRESLPGDGVGEIRATFIGSTLTSIGKSITFPDDLKTASAISDWGGTPAAIMGVMFFLYVIIIATIKKYWVHLSQKIAWIFYLPFVGYFILLNDLVREVARYKNLGAEAYDIRIQLFVGPILISVLMLAVSAAIGILSRLKLSILPGLVRTPKISIRKDALAISMLIGMICGPIIAVAQHSYQHVILMSCGIDYYPGMMTGTTPDSYFGIIGIYLLGISAWIAPLCLAMIAAVMLGEYLRLRILGWVLAAIVWSCSNLDYCKGLCFCDKRRS